jgi:hypothetical protein
MIPFAIQNYYYVARCWIVFLITRDDSEMKTITAMELSEHLF